MKIVALTFCVLAVIVSLRQVAGGVDTDNNIVASGGVVNLSVANRSVVVYQPARALQKYAHGGTVAAIFALKATYGTPWRTRGEDGFEPYADRFGFLVVYPDTKNGIADLAWDYQADLFFFAALVQRLTDKDFGLDPQKVFVAGWSSGGSMALFLQNEVDLFAAAASVQGGACRLELWTPGRRGHRTILFWNKADPMVAGPYYNETMRVLRPSGSLIPESVIQLPTSAYVGAAEIRRYGPDVHAELVEVSWETPASGVAAWQAEPDTYYWDWPHQWPRVPPLTFSATSIIMDFFLNGSTS